MIDAEQDRIIVIGPGFQIKLVVDVKTKQVKRADPEALTHQIFQRKVSKATPFDGAIVIKLSATNDATQLLDAIYQLPGFEDTPIQTAGDDSGDELEVAVDVNEEAPTQRTTIPTQKIWEHLIEAEKDALPELEVRGQSRPHPSREDLILVPYWCATGFESAPDEEGRSIPRECVGDAAKRWLYWIIAIPTKMRSR